MAKLSPAMQQYATIKSDYPDLLLFYQMGDFYELFYSDAEKAARILDLTLTSRSQAQAKPIPMAGVPVHSADSYIAKLIKQGESVIICDQIGDPKASKGIVDRKIVRIITPGTLTEESLLQAKTDNFLMAIYQIDSVYGIASLDLSAAFFNLQEVTSLNEVNDEIERIKPAEIITSDDQNFSFSSNPYPAWHFELDSCKKNLCEQMQTRDLSGFGCNDLSSALCAAGALLNYAKETQQGAIPHLNRISVETKGDYLQIDANSRLCLEIDYSMTGHNENTLFAVFDHVSCAMGGRCLKRWFNQPLKNQKQIIARQDAIENLIKNEQFNSFRAIFEQLSDIERITSRIAMQRTKPRDLVGLRTSLKLIPETKSLLNQMNDGLLKDLNDHLVEQSESVDFLERAIVDNPPTSIREGGVIKQGYDDELDKLRTLSKNADQYMIDLEQREKVRTKISSLRISYNRIHGFFIEVPRAQAIEMPADYQRTQTLKNNERFTIPELKEYEARVLTAQEQALLLEKKLYQELLEKLSLKIKDFYICARSLAQLDALANLAYCATTYHHTRPTIGDDERIDIKGGKHPVIEKISEEPFIPNDLLLNSDNKVLLITGPNMGGKSTYMRQTAIITLLAHIGAWVPAQSAYIGRVDRIFTRIGASDDISSGRSTFMIEMTEVANILNNANRYSLVLLDEIGRGTSTFDGLSLAWACGARIACKNLSYTLFATHYFELTALPNYFSTVKNVHLNAVESNNTIAFMYKVKQGATNKSYGIQVAKLAGVPADTLQIAKQKLSELEQASVNADDSDKNQLNLLANNINDDNATESNLPSKLESALQQLNPEELTPKQALDELYILKSLLEK